MYMMYKYDDDVKTSSFIYKTFLNDWKFSGWKAPFKAMGILIGLLSYLWNLTFAFF